jgi:diguanylate cyclase (GGDEF)-like protein
MRILIAGDSKFSRATLRDALTKLGHKVLVAENGEEAIKLFQMQRPDLVILDVLMEIMDGFECATKLRAINESEWIPIIFLSSAIDDESIAKGIDAGGDDYLSKPFSEITLSAKIKSMQRIADMRHKLIEATEKLEALSSTDALTGLYNRFQFDRTLQEVIAQTTRDKQLAALLFIDVDHFKNVNDSLGHHIGDLLLQEVVKRLSNSLRINDFIARLGGDEFAVILRNIEGISTAEEVAKKIIGVFSSPFTIKESKLQITVSIGIACYPYAGEDPSTLMQNADIAMYMAKKAGRNQYQLLHRAEKTLRA